MKPFQLDLHHIVLYAVLFVVSLGALEVVHTWRLDVETAKIKASADEKEIQDVARDAAKRAKQYQAQVELLQRQRVTPKTPPLDVFKRLQGLEPAMSILPEQLVAPKPDAPKANLVLSPAQQIILVNDLVDCKECQLDRQKLEDELGVEKLRTIAAQHEADVWKEAAAGGSLWKRIKRRAWYFLEDAIAVEALRCAGGHC